MKMGGGDGDSDTFPSGVGNANFPDYLSAFRSGAAGVTTANRANPELASVVIRYRVIDPSQGKLFEVVWKAQAECLCQRCLAQRRGIRLNTRIRKGTVINR